MNLYLLRHGVADEPDASGNMADADRPLTNKGERRTLATAQALRRLEIGFDLILSSPYLRARQTAEILADALDLRKRLEFCETLAPGGKLRKLITEISSRQPEPKSLLLVGHEPALSRLATLLIWGEAGPGITLKKGALCKLLTSGLQPGPCATLEWLLTANQMSLLA